MQVVWIKPWTFQFTAEALTIMISWHGTRAWQADWDGRVLALLLSGEYTRKGTARDDMIYVAMNMYWETLPFELPGLTEEGNEEDAAEFVKGAKSMLQR